MTPERALAVAHAELVAAADQGDDGRLDWAFDRLAAALDRFSDDDAAVEALEGCMDRHLDALRGRWAAPSDEDGLSGGVVNEDAADAAVLYLALVEDFFAACDLPFDVARTRVRRARLLIAQEREDAARMLLLGSLAQTDAVPVEVYGGRVHGLLASVVHEQNPSYAVHLLGEAVDRYRAAGDDVGVAEMLILRAGPLEAIGLREQAALDYEEAAKVWASIEVLPEERAERDQEIAEATFGAGIQYLDMAMEAIEAEDVPRWTTVLRRGFPLLQAGRNAASEEDFKELGGVDALLVLAATLLAWGLLRQRDDGVPIAPAEALAALGAVEALTPAVDDETRLGYLTMAAVAHGLSSEQPVADAAARRALDLARRVRDHAAVTFLRAAVAALATGRPQVDTGELKRALEGYGAELASALRHQRVSQKLLSEDESAFSDIEEMTADASDTSGSDDLLLLGLRVVYQARGEIPGEARSSLGRLELAFERLARTMPAEHVVRLRPMVVMARAAVLFADGRRSEADRLLRVETSEQLAAGGRGWAARLQGLAGQFDVEAGRPRSGAERLMTSAIAVRAELADLPSSAERAAQRAMTLAILEAAVSAVAAVDDRTLLAELVETLRCQSLPEPLAPDAPVRSLLALMSDADDVAQPWAEQETVVTVPPRVVMPWGAAALGRHYDEAARFAPALADAPLVRLVVPR